MFAAPRDSRFGTPLDTCATLSNRAMWLQREEDRPMLRTLLPASTLLCVILLPLAGHAAQLDELKSLNLELPSAT